MGKITRGENKNRAIELNDKPIISSVTLPVVGEIAAGQPILAEENWTDKIVINENFFVGSNLFVLKVKGDSMINAGILDHDYIFVRKQNFANNGDIVVALIDGEETTVKRYFKDLRSIRLQPENDAYSPIIGGDNIQVMGKVIAVFRML